MDSLLLRHKSTSLELDWLSTSTCGLPSVGRLHVDGVDTASNDERRPITVSQQTAAWSDAVASNI